MPNREFTGLKATWLFSGAGTSVFLLHATSFPQALPALLDPEDVPALPLLWLSFLLHSGVVTGGACTAQSIQEHQGEAVGLRVYLLGYRLWGAQPLQATVDGSSKAQRAELITGDSLYVKTLSESNSTFHIRKAVCWDKPF